MEVLQIVSVLDIQTMSTGLPILIDELRRSGRGGEVKEGPLTAQQEKLKQEFVLIAAIGTRYGSSSCNIHRNSPTPTHGCRRCRGRTAHSPRGSAS
jgi:hypothetical protein